MSHHPVDDFIENSIRNIIKDYALPSTDQDELRSHVSVFESNPDELRLGAVRRVLASKVTDVFKFTNLIRAQFILKSKYYMHTAGDVIQM